MNKAIGFIVLLFVIVGVAYFAMQSSGPGNSVAGRVTGQTITLRGFVGGEKRDLLADPKLVEILKRKYGITLDTARRGSLEMVSDPKAAEQDFLWPGSQFAADLYRDSGRPIAGEEVVLYSPIVLYSWKSVVSPLTTRGIVKQSDGTAFVEDMGKLVQMVEKGTEWKSIGVTKLYGKMAIFSTDPKSSNSGSMLAALLASLLNGGNVVTEATVQKVAPEVKSFFDRQGFMESSSDAIFTQALNRGVGDKPILVGYEAQLLETYAKNPSLISKRADQVQMLYPRPTVWTSHVLIALSPNGKKLIDALKDPEIQKIAWQLHGFRSATGEATDIAAFSKLGVPETIDNVIPMPSGKTMKRLLDSL